MESKDFRPKGRSLKPLRALGPFLWRYRGTLLLALIALLVASGRHAGAAGGACAT